MSEKLLFLDFETRSAADLRECGAHKYAEHPTTDIMCTGFAFDDDEPQVVPQLQLPKDVFCFVNNHGTVVAHNAIFERCIWNGPGVRRYGATPLYASQMICTMSLAYSLSLPGSLEAGTAAAGIEQKKDMVGNRLMLKLSKPRRIDKNTGEITWWEDPDEIARLFDYCKQDLRVTQVYKPRLLNLSHTERRIWEMDQAINDRGIPIDLSSTHLAMKLVEEALDKLNLEMRELTTYAVGSCLATVTLKEWLETHLGHTIEGVAKSDVSDLLARPSLLPHVRRALEIRQEASKSSTAKLRAFVDRACADSRVRGVFQYWGATTGRWAGRGIQPHNFPRPTISQEAIDQVFTQLHSSEEIELFHGPVLSTVSNALRGFIKAPDGKEFIAADFSAIEARVLAWLAGSTEELNLFRVGGKIYEKAASEIHGVPENKVTKDQRQIGKVARLALGYQGGVNAFQQMARGYGVRITPEVAQDLWGRSPIPRKEKAKWGWEQRGRKSGIPKSEWLGCELIKLAWREANPEIVRYWADVEAAAMKAVQQPGKTVSLRNVSYKVKGSFLFCRLPSGRCIAYPYPEIKEVKTSWGEIKPMLRYKGEDVRKRWERTNAYGGLLVENITQAVSRDLLAEAMLRCESSKLPVVLHVHDEIVCEVDEASPITVQEFEKLVAEVPFWAGDLPISAEGWRGKRYRK